MVEYKNDNLESIEYVSNTYFLKWYMTSWCNYHCSYCIQAKDKLKKLSQQEIENNAKLINSMLIRNNIQKPLFLKLIGGECTIYDLIPVLDQFTVNIKNVTLTTNFFRPNEYFKDLLNYCRHRGINLILCLSKHSENANFYDKALDLTTWCRENNYKDPEISIVAPHDLDENLNTYLDLGIHRVKVCPERNGLANNSYIPTDTERSLINRINQKNTYLQSDGNYLFRFKDGHVERRRSVSDYVTYFDHGGLIPDGRLCSVGLTSITVRPDGDVYRGGCTYTNNFKDPDNNRLGWISDPEFKLPTTPILCKINSMDYSSNLNVRCLPCDHVSLGKIIDENLYNEVIEKEIKLNDNR